MAVDGNVHRGERGGVFPLEKCGQGVHHPVIAAAVLTVLPELLRSMNDYRMLIYAIVLIVVMIFNQSPEMIALRKRLTARFRKEDAEGKGAKDKKGVA